MENVDQETTVNYSQSKGTALFTISKTNDYFKFQFENMDVLKQDTTKVLMQCGPYRLCLEQREAHIRDAVLNFETWLRFCIEGE